MINYGLGIMEFWDLEDNEIVIIFVGLNLGVLDVVFLVDGKKLVVGSWDGIVRVWDVVIGKLLNEIGKSRLKIVK